MQFWIFLTTALASLTLTGPHESAPTRVLTSDAMHEMGVQACSRLYATDAERVLACRNDYFASSIENDWRLDALSPEDELQCTRAGGVIADRMPACEDALAALIKACDEEESLTPSAFFYLLGNYSDRCNAKSLCVSE